MIWCLKQLKYFIPNFSLSDIIFLQKAFLNWYTVIPPLFLQVGVLMRWSAVKLFITDKKKMFISFSIIHRQPYISLIMKDFVKLYTFTCISICTFA